MNQPDTASPNVTTAPSGEIPGIARVTAIVPPWGSAQTPAARSTNTIPGDFVGSILGKVARVLNPGLIELALSWSKKAGHYAVLAGCALTVAYAIYGAIKHDSFAVFAVGIGFVVALAVAQFAAIRFLGAADTIIASTPSRISSTAFLDCVGLLVLLGAAAMLLGGIAGAIAARSAVPLIPALISSTALTCFGAVALHPRMVNVVSGEGTAGEEAIGLISFFFKTGLKLVPLFFVLLSAAGALTLLMSFFGEGGAFASMAQSIVNVVPLPITVPYGLSGSALILVACLAPIFTYFVFLLQYLVVDVLRAILAVPGKLDSLRR